MQQIKIFIKLCGLMRVDLNIRAQVHTNKENLLNLDTNTGNIRVLPLCYKSKK